MNAPEQFELFVLPKGKAKIEYTEDHKVQNAGTFVIFLEDHTLGNLLRMQLLRDARVKFAGYRMPHPLENKIELKVQTNGDIPPTEAVGVALGCLSTEVNTLVSEFQSGLDKIKGRGLQS